jgi:hypothetical protein
MDTLVKIEEKKIRKALKDAKKQSARWARHISRPDLHVCYDSSVVMCPVLLII